MRLRSGNRVEYAGMTLAWLGVASLTATGGVLGSLMVAVQGSWRSVRAWWVAGLCLALQLPWLVPALLGTAQLTSDPDGVRVFAASPEGPGGVVTALLGLGGVWDARSVPVTRETWWTAATAVLVVFALLLGRKPLRFTLGSGGLVRLWVIAGIGLAIALLPTLPPGEASVTWLVEHVPGSGLLRDSQKFLAPFVLLAVCSIGALADRAVRAAAGSGPEIAFAVAVVAVPTPLVLLPDGAATVWPTLRPVHYPAGFERVDRILGRSDAGYLATLPWRSYRAFSWGSQDVSSDPAVRWFDRRVVTDDSLRVGATTVSGESRRARDLGRALPSRSSAEALRASGVSWVLVYRDDPAATDLDLSGLEPVYRDPDMALFRVPGSATAPSGSSPAVRVVVVALDVAAAGIVMGGVWLAWRGRRQRRRTGVAATLPLE